MDREGWILTTSFAVPKDSKEAIVILTEDPAGPTRKAAKVVGRDLSRGLVLLKIETAGPLPVPEWVSRDQLAAGLEAAGCFQKGFFQREFVRKVFEKIAGKHHVQGCVRNGPVLGTVLSKKFHVFGEVGR